MNANVNVNADGSISVDATGNEENLCNGSRPMGAFDHEKEIAVNLKSEMSRYGRAWLASTLCDMIARDEIAKRVQDDADTLVRILMFSLRTEHQSNGVLAMLDTLIDG